MRYLTRRLSLSAPDDNPDRHAVQTERAAENVLEIAQIREVRRLLEVRKEHELRRPVSRLRAIENLQRIAAGHRRRTGVPCLAEDPIELAGGASHLEGLMEFAH